MKKLISIFFMLALCGTFLPAVLSFEKQEVVLFSTVEEEQSHHIKELKGKDDLKSVVPDAFYLQDCVNSHASYKNLSLLFFDDPCLGNHTPPPDSFC